MRARPRPRAAPAALALALAGCFVDAPVDGSGGASTGEGGTTTTTGESTTTTTTATNATTTTTTATTAASATTATTTDATTTDATTTDATTGETTDASTTGCPPHPFYADADADSYGDPETEVLACDAPPGHVADAGDCDDGDETVHPDAAEICDGIDNDCDTFTDEWSATNILCGGCEMALGGESVYHRCPGPLTWSAGRSACQARGGDLATVSSGAEQDFIAALMAGEGAHWIGLSDQAVEGTFVWVDGAALTVKYWGNGEPNNSGGNEDCVHLISSSGLWNDANCNQGFDVVCESPAPP